MEKIALLTDSASDLSLETIEENNIELLPLLINYSHGTYRDKLDISADEVYKNLQNEVPKTSLPSAANTESILTRLEQEGYTHVIAITISSGLSGTFNSIRLALDNHPKLKNFIYDSKILAMPEGALVLEVAKLIKDGKSFDSIVKDIPIIHSKIKGFFTINTLDYLKKGGRIGRVAGTLGEILNIKPIVSVDENGVYYTVAKTRGRKQSILKLIDILKNELTLSKCKVWVLHGGALEEGIKIMNSLKTLDNIVSLDISEISPALGVHGGPGLLGLAIEKVC